MKSFKDILARKKSKQLEKTTAAGGEAYLDSGLTDMEAGPENPSSKPDTKSRQKYLKSKGKAPYELEDL